MGRALVLFAAALALAGCSDSIDIEIERDTLSDPLGDIAIREGMIYATNHDESGHAGSQVDLLTFSLADPSEPLDTVMLELNGQGYLAMATDGLALFLQPRDRSALLKVSPAGRILWLRQDLQMADAFMRACGICYDAEHERLVALYTKDGSSFVVRRYSADFDSVVSTSAPIAWDVFAPGTPPQAVAWDGGVFYVLGTDAGGNGLVVATDATFATPTDPRQVGPGAVGLAASETQIWVSYADRSIVAYRDERRAQ